MSSKIYLLLFAISLSFVAMNADACDNVACKADFDSLIGTGYGGADYRQINTKSDLKQVESVLSYYDRCECFVKSDPAHSSYLPPIIARLKSMAPEARTRINAAEANLESVKSSCPIYDKCAEDEKDLSQFAYSSQKEKEYTNFYQRCKCYADNSSKKAEYLDAIEKYKEILAEEKASAEKAKADALARDKRMKDQEALRAEQDKKQQIAEAAHSKRQNSVECKKVKYIYEYCSNLSKIKALKEGIDNENEVGRQSGFVNAVSLRKMTAGKIALEKDNKRLSEEFKSFGGSITQRQCNQQSLDRDLDKICGGWE